MNEEFITLFIKDCVNNGFSTPTEMCNCAREKINNLEKKIREIEVLRIEQGYLRAVIKRLGGEIKKTRNKNTGINLDKDLCVKICKFVQNNNKATISDIIHRSTIASIEDNPLVYRAIQWLVGQGYLSRDNSSSERFVIKGDKWEERPV